MSNQTLRAKPDVTSGILTRMAQIAVMLMLIAAELFISVGRLDWVWAWVWMGVYLIGIAINANLMLRRHPETVAERAGGAGMKQWDKLIGGFWTLVYFVIIPIVAGLDVRFGWTGELSSAVHLAGAFGFALGLALFSWAMVTNAYFSTVVRIQTERGHAVCTAGPYRHVRHPGYVGAILQTLAVPLLLGSYWALLPGAAAALLMLIRTAFEDRTLRAELPGYAEYAQKVRYRLLPGVW